MLFNSVDFLIFFAIVFVLYYVIKPSLRWIMLLIASYFFYMCWEPSFILLILFSTIVDYFIARKLSDSKGANRKKLLLVSLVVNLGVLFVFKYFNFFNESVQYLTDWMGFSINSPNLNLLLPVGISFYTFQTLSYTIDVYRNQMEAERHFGKFALYVAFFPQLVAGPIERASNLLPQLSRNENALKYNNTVVGFTQITYGLFKKVVVSDTLAQFVNAVYNNYEVHSGLSLLIATYLFAFQIYCDFSGYSDIAIGTARMMGYRFMDNFQLPYFSKNVTEFWRRWHISLSSWLRDYLYIPLGGNRHGTFNTYKNLTITMLLGGLWHGASWNFVIWGLLNGAYLSIERALGIRAGYVKRGWIKKGVLTFFTFNLICLTWIFFRAGTFDQAIAITGKIFQGDYSRFVSFSMPYLSSVLLVLTLLLTIDFGIFRKISFDKLFTSYPIPLVILFNVFFWLIILLFGVVDGEQFIYFQF